MHRRMLDISYREHKMVCQQVDILARRQELVLSSITSYQCHGLATSVVMIRCRRSYYKKQQMVVITEKDLVNHGRKTSRKREAIWCRHCCASRMKEVDGQSSQQMHLSEQPNDAWASRVFVSLLVIKGRGGLAGGKGLTDGICLHTMARMLKWLCICEVLGNETLWIVCHRKSAYRTYTISFKSNCKMFQTWFLFFFFRITRCTLLMSKSCFGVLIQIILIQLHQLILLNPTIAIVHLFNIF